MAKILIRPRAEEDLYSIWSFILNENQDRKLADRFLLDLTGQFNTLLFNPKLGRSLEESFPDLRRMVYKNYLIFYRPVEHDIEIVRVLHGARDWEIIL